MAKTIIHVDMDAFYAAVEVRDDPKLAHQPLIIGALPSERGVVSTASYEAREFGVHSGMSIKDAYRLCPKGIYMHPNMAKYKAVSQEIHKIWNDYTDMIEYISLDEGYLDITGSLKIFGGARQIGEEIKQRTKADTGLTCSVGIGYSLTAAKLASEEKKPDGFFEIPDKQAFVSLIIDREVRTIYGIGKKTAEKLQQLGIYTVRDIQAQQRQVLALLGKNGQQIVELAQGIDRRQVVAYWQADAKSIGREHTFQQDISDIGYLKDALVLLAKDLSMKMRTQGIYGRTITLKITYANMQQISRSNSGDPTNQADQMYKTAAALLDEVERRPIRLVGISISNLSDGDFRQLTLADIANLESKKRKDELDSKLLALQKKYGADIIKTGIELKAEQRFNEDD